MDPDDVTDFKSFLAFVHALAADRAASVAKERVAASHSMGPEANGWENTTIEGFLEAAAAWASDRYQGGGPEPSWREFANLLVAGKIYE